MNPFYSNTPDIKNQMHIDLFINRDEELLSLKEWLLSEKIDESIGAVIGQPRIGKSHLCYKALSDLEKEKSIEYIMVKANRAEQLSNLLRKLYRIITGKIKNIPPGVYENNETLKLFYQCVREDIAHFDELLLAAVDSITREVSVVMGETLKSKIQANVEGKIETKINLFITAALSLKTFFGTEREKAKQKTESKSQSVVYTQPRERGLMDMVNDFTRGYSILTGEKPLLLYIDDLDRISHDPEENNRMISELIYYLKDLSSRNPNLLVFASIGEAFYNMNKEKFFRRISLLRPLENSDLRELYKRRCNMFGVQFLSQRTAGELAKIFKGFPGRFLDALDKLYVERRKIRLKGLKDIFAYCNKEIEELENGIRASITGLKHLLESKVEKGLNIIKQNEFGPDLELSRTPLVGEILWEIAHEPGVYRLNPLYWQAIKQQTTSQ
jgi:Cdc6-like AAA superfamily ATPase